VCFVDTVCQPTKQRQNAAIELAQKCDAVIVIGGAHSNNTHELVKTCSRFCARVQHVQTADDLQAGWFDGVQTIGITAGTSTPDETVDAVEARLKEFAGYIHPSHHEEAHPREEHEHSAAVRAA
jgi:4-hydroxy-3-methylbut-2-enyl diphosphate reductase